MFGAHDVEMATVDRDDRVHAESFRNGDHRRVNETQVKIRVTINELGGTLILITVEVLNAEFVTAQTLKELCLSMWPDPTGKQPTHFHDHRSGHDDVAVKVVEELDTLDVMRVVPIGNRDKWTGVNKNASRHEANSARRIVL